MESAFSGSLQPSGKVFLGKFHLATPQVSEDLKKGLLTHATENHGANGDGRGWRRELAKKEKEKKKNKTTLAKEWLAGKACVDEF